MATETMYGSANRQQGCGSWADLGKVLGKLKGRPVGGAHKCLKKLVAGGGFEPPTFGL